MATIEKLEAGARYYNRTKRERDQGDLVVHGKHLQVLVASIFKVLTDDQKQAVVDRMQGLGKYCKTCLGA
jgi:hypothetical protein